MVRAVGRKYDAFIILKTEVCEKVTTQNAKKMLDDAKNQIMKKLQKLDIHNITEIENLYLIFAQLAQAASYLAAMSKADNRKETSFDLEIENIGFDDINPILLDAFKDNPQALNLHKINTIDSIYMPTKEAWAGLHIRMLIVANATKSYNVMKVLKETLPAYKEYLEYKLRENGVNIPLQNEKLLEIPLNSMVKKMIKRYQAVLDLEERIKDKNSLTAKDMKFAKEQIKKCLDNNPDWTERPFLQKLIDVLSFGIKPLYQAFFSKEKELQKTMEQSIKIPKMRRY